jgi:hypothetical protein
MPMITAMQARTGRFISREHGAPEQAASQTGIDGEHHGQRRTKHSRRWEGAEENEEARRNVARRRSQTADTTVPMTQGAA